MPADIEIYCKCMAEVRHRLGVVQAVLAGRVRTHRVKIALQPIVGIV
jgi:hypothetical protein